jgi:DNA processing protein
MSRGLPPEAYVIALLQLSGMGPARLALLLTDRSPEDAWQLILERRAAPLLGVSGHKLPNIVEWQTQARQLDPAELLVAHESVTMLLRHSEEYPQRLVDDLDPPELLFALGRSTLASAPTVAVVGTRRCTRYGRDIATELGFELGVRGVTVVSGLARGIDAAVHRAVLDAGGFAVAVVATGLDVVYPRSSRDLWHEVAECGALFTEMPLGSAALPWRFPARNRIIAGLADVTVVVESHEKGGSLYTAEEAHARGRTVFAVPGPIRSAASAGTNALLADGSLAMCSIEDVCVAVDAKRVRPAQSQSGLPTEHENEILAALGWEAKSLGQLVLLTGMAPTEVALLLDELSVAGLVTGSGGFYERAVPLG